MRDYQIVNLANDVDAFGISSAPVDLLSIASKEVIKVGDILLSPGKNPILLMSVSRILVYASMSATATLIPRSTSMVPQ